MKDTKEKSKTKGENKLEEKGRRLIFSPKKCFKGYLGIFPFSSLKGEGVALEENKGGR